MRNQFDNITLTRESIAALVAAYLASGRTITICPPALRAYRPAPAKPGIHAN